MMSAIVHQGEGARAGLAGRSHHGGARRLARRPIPQTLLGVGLLAIVSLGNGAPAGAQQAGYYGGSANPNVYVNNDLLNRLGPGGMAPALPYGGGYYPQANYGGYPYAGGYGGYGAAAPGTVQGPNFLTRPGTLLFPPAAYPKSVLVDRGALAAARQPQAQAQAQAPQLRPPQSQAKQQQAERPVLTPPTAPKAPAAAPKASLVPPPPVPVEEPQAPKKMPAVPKAPSAMAQAPTPPSPPAPGGESSGMGAGEGTQTAAREAGGEVAAPPPPVPLPPASETAGTGAAGQGSEEALTPPPPAAPKAEPQSMAKAPSPEQPAGQTAALPKAEEPAATGDTNMRLQFPQGSAELSDEVKSELRRLAKTLIQDGNARVQLLAYATSSEDSPSRARRLSLSRALAVRAYLIDQGVRSTRMDVRALGDKAPDSPKDRVDIEPARR